MCTFAKITVIHLFARADMSRAEEHVQYILVCKSIVVLIIVKKSKNAIKALIFENKFIFCSG